MLYIINYTHTHTHAHAHAHTPIYMYINSRHKFTCTVLYIVSLSMPCKQLLIIYSCTAHLNL